MSHQSLMAGYGNPQIIVDGADFDGANDYMLRGGGLTGAADSKTGILSCYIRLDGGDGTTRYIINGSQTNYFIFEIDSDNKYKIVGSNGAASMILYIHTVNTYTAGAAWVHLLASWDLNTGNSHLYINDIDDLSVQIETNDTLDYTLSEWSVGAAIGGTNKTNGCIAELYFAPGQYLDFSILANRRKFISASGKPVHLGTTGALPTGTAPLIYHHLDNGEAVANFATNRGTGGSFSITGTLDTASSSPSD